MPSSEPDVAEARPAPAERVGRPRRAAVPIAPEGWPFILVPLAVAAGVAWLGWPKTAVAVVVVAAFMAFFFRDPERTPPATAGAIVAPADGRVTEVRDRVDDPFVGPARQVVIFLSPLDVHVNRAAIAGRVARVEYASGGFLPAYRREAERNERVSIALDGEAGRVVMRQVAGVLARRIVCRARVGDRLALGERFGLIRFGSRMDVVMPVRARILVKPGDRVRAGETIVGLLE